MSSSSSLINSEYLFVEDTYSIICKYTALTIYITPINRNPAIKNDITKDVLTAHLVEKLES